MSYRAKAKRKDNNEWIEGYYVCLNETHHRIYTGCAEKDCGTYYPDWFAIDEKTLCKPAFLGELCGPIWEHDLVEVTTTDGFEEDTEIVEVVETKHGFTPWSWEYECDGCDLRCEVLSVTLKGNIFDNPELLESARLFSR